MRQYRLQAAEETSKNGFAFVSDCTTSGAKNIGYFAAVNAAFSKKILA
jgi:hypothetical protein